MNFEMLAERIHFTNCRFSNSAGQYAEPFIMPKESMPESCALSFLLRPFHSCRSAKSMAREYQEGLTDTHRRDWSHYQDSGV